MGPPFFYGVSPFNAPPKERGVITIYGQCNKVCGKETKRDLSEVFMNTNMHAVGMALAILMSYTETPRNISCIGKILY